MVHESAYALIGYRPMLVTDKAWTRLPLSMHPFLCLPYQIKKLQQKWLGELIDFKFLAHNQQIALI